MRRLKEGDKMTYEDSQKLHSLYELYEQPMYRIAFAVLHSSSLAEDAVSDAFVTVIRHCFERFSGNEG